MHTGISDNRQLILSDRKANSTTRIEVSTIRENLEKLDRNIATFIYESSERLNVVENTQKTNTTSIEEFNSNLSAQLTKMVEEY
jgi:hypothetical protein